MNLDEIKQEIVTSAAQSVSLQEQIKQQSETIEKLERYLEQMRQRHAEQLRVVQRQMTVRSDEAQAELLRALRREIGERVRDIEAATARAVGGAVDAGRRRLAERVREQEAERQRQRQAPPQVYRQTYVEQLARERAQLEKQLVVAQQENARRRDHLQRLRDAAAQLRQDLRGVISDEFLRDDLDAEALRERLNDARSIAGYTDACASQYTKLSGAVTNDSRDLSEHAERNSAGGEMGRCMMDNYAQ